MRKTILLEKMLAFFILLTLVSALIIPSMSGTIGETTDLQNTMPSTDKGTIDVPDDYPSIQAAIDNASANDTIYVHTGTYNENIIIDKTVTLIGDGIPVTTIDGSGTGNVVQIIANGVHISGFTIRNSGSSISNAGIYLNSDDTNITVNALVDNYYGILIEDPSNNNVISGNTIVGHTLGGISLHTASNNTIRENVLTGNNFWGIYLEYAHGNELVDNMIQNHGHGIYLLSSSHNRIGRNTIQNNNGGFYLVYSDENHIFKNTIHNNPYGLELDYSYDNTICGNNITQSQQYGIELADFPATTNIFYHNNFMSNTWNAWDQYTNIWNLALPVGGNYWDDYWGSDTNGDGFGDTPHSIPGPGGNLDWYPLIDPWTPPICGEVTHDGILDVADVVYLINYLYKQGPAPEPLCTGDVNYDGIIDIADVVFILNYLFKQGPAPGYTCCDC
jgi:parallel beta-helix repeat protein